jgi:hypothetical protein
MLSEVANLVLRESNVLNGLWRDRADESLKLLFRNAKTRRCPIVELLGELADGRVSAFPDGAYNPFHSCSNLHIVGVRDFGFTGGLK